MESRHYAIKLVSSVIPLNCLCEVHYAIRYVKIPLTHGVQQYRSIPIPLTAAIHPLLEHAVAHLIHPMHRLKNVFLSLCDYQGTTEHTGGS